MTEQTIERRKVRNQLIRPQSQLSLAVPFLILLIGAVSIVVYIFLVFSSAINENSPMMSADFAQSMLEMQTSLFIICSIGISVFAIICTVLWLVSTHRIFGPMVQIERHIDKMLDGDFSGTIQLRQLDEFKPLAERLNQLTVDLKNKK